MSLTRARQGARQVTLLLGLLLGLQAALPARAEGLPAPTWRVALIGDVPYSEAERRELPLMLEAIAQADTRVVIHVGDIKHGGGRCDDAVFADRLALFQASPVPLVYVPGDNDWTDCHRASNGSYEPEERLEQLRRLFWTDNRSLGRKKLSLERQAGPYREHSRFILGPVLFVTLNLPGGDNNWGKTDVPSEEFRQRHPAVLDWLTNSFALARRKKLAGVVVLVQANPGLKHFAQGLGHRSYLQFLETLRGETERFKGQVVLVHGDTHQARVDHPLLDPSRRPQQRFTRVESYGYPSMGWIEAVIDTNTPELFSFTLHPWPPIPTPTPSPAQ